MRKTGVHTAHAPQPGGAYSQGIVANGLLYTAGFGPQDPADGNALVVRSLGIDWLDVLVDDAFLPSVPVTGSTTRVALPAGWATLEVGGRTRGRLLQRRVLRAG